MAQTAEKIDMAHEECAEATAGSHGSFCWNELMTHNPAQAKKFYADTIGWSFDAMPMQDGGTYWVAKAGDKMAGGIFELKGECEGAPEGWMPYLAVDDVDKRVEKALRAGAKLIRPLFDIPGIGRIAILREPGGAGIGWMKPAKS